MSAMFNDSEMNNMVERLRIFCADCSSRVQIVERHRSLVEDCWMFWILCCGRNQLVRVNGERVHALRMNGKQDIFRSDLDDVTEQVPAWFAQTEKILEDTAARLTWLDRFIKSGTA